MSTSGSWKKLKPCGLGGQPVVITGELLDAILEAINSMGQMELVPQSNCGKWIANDGQWKLDLMDIDNRFRGLEQAVGVSYVNTIVNNNPSTSISITQQITNINNRLDNATITVNCVSNTIVGAVHF